MARKKTTKKKVTKRSGSGSAAPPSSRAGKKRKVTKKKRKVSKAEKKATRPTRRKPTTNRAEVKDYFQREDLVLTPKLTAELKMVFCRAYSRHGIISDGLSAAGVSRKTYYKWLKEDESFGDNCKMAKELANDFMEREARRRAIEGFDRPVIYKGEVTEYYKDYSDSLLSMLMRGNKPEKYKERTEHSGSVGRPLTLDQEDKEDVVASILGMIKNKPDPD